MAQPQEFLYPLSLESWIHDLSLGLLDLGCQVSWACFAGSMVPKRVELLQIPTTVPQDPSWIHLLPAHTSLIHSFHAFSPQILSLLKIPVIYSAVKTTHPQPTQIFPKNTVFLTQKQAEAFESTFWIYPSSDIPFAMFEPSKSDPCILAPWKTLPEFIFFKQLSQLTPCLKMLSLNRFYSFLQTPQRPIDQATVLLLDPLASSHDFGDQPENSPKPLDFNNLMLCLHAAKQGVPILTAETSFFREFSSVEKYQTLPASSLDHWSSLIGYFRKKPRVVPRELTSSREKCANAYLDLYKQTLSSFLTRKSYRNKADAEL